MKRYDSYKDSGIEWIGEIPSHWTLKKLKFFGKITLGKMLTPDDKGGYVLKPYLRAKNIEWYSPKIEEVKEMWFSEKELNQYKLYKNDLLVSEGGEVGRTCIWNDELEECYIQNSVQRVAFNNFESAKYFLNQFVLFGKRGHFDAIVNRISIAHLTKEKLGDVDFVYPPIDEQTAIANYLDHKTTQIDDLIAQKERLIQLLQEERMAIINQAVTKGIDSTVSMKDSGIEWLGEIPAHWNYSSLKWYSKIYSGGTPSKDIAEYWINGTIPWLNSGCVNQWDISEVSEYITEDAFNSSSAKWIPNKSLVIALAGQGKTKGMVAQVQFETTCNQSLGVIVPNEKIYNRFLQYWLKNNYLNIRSLGGGDKRDGLNLVMIGGIPIPIPSFDEQVKIAEYLDIKNGQVDIFIQKSKQEIVLLKEYKSALISDVVTGKLDVKNEKLN
jgi:type I restriction enzyme S subunit